MKWLPHSIRHDMITMTLFWRTSDAVVAQCTCWGSPYLLPCRAMIAIYYCITLPGKVRLLLSYRIRWIIKAAWQLLTRPRQWPVEAGPLSAHNGPFTPSQLNRPLLPAHCGVSTNKASTWIFNPKHWSAFVAFADAALSKLKYMTLLTDKHGRDLVTKPLRTIRLHVKTCQIDLKFSRTEHSCLNEPFSSFFL